MHNKLRSCGGDLTRWSAQKAQEAEREIMEKTNRVKKEKENEVTHNVAIIKGVQEELRLLSEQDNMKWKQRAKRSWYQLSDKNSKYFHACDSQRSKKNWIKHIKDFQGRMVTE